MANEQSEFWSKVALKYDQVVDLQIGRNTRSMARERVAKEGRLGELAEFGCGTGFYTGVLADKANNVLATDVSPGMLALAKDQIKASTVTFQVEDCQETSLPAGALDTVFLGLVIHFTQPDRTLAEMRRILKPGGMLLILNLDPRALTGLERVRSLIRILYQGLTGYRLKPPKGFGRNMLTAKELCDLLATYSFKVASAETIKDTSRSSNIPLEYVRAVKV
jgi:ubiquinone/menaquinone biosynthesis C-methylase UbiE